MVLMAVHGLEGAGSTLILANGISLTCAMRSEQKCPQWGERGEGGSADGGDVSGTVTRELDGSFTFEPPGFLPPRFAVVFGPCTLADGGRCVGRWPGGYLPNEHCEIKVAGPGTIGECPIFDTWGYESRSRLGDVVTTPDGRMYGGNANEGASCPIGLLLHLGQTLTWQSDDIKQGDNGNGLPFVRSIGAGGGWQVCFA
jgi:hypothetical protein